MATRNELYPSRFQQSGTIKSAPGGRLVDTITSVELETMPARDGQPARSKPVIYFQNSKPLVLNMTNYNFIADTLGEETDNWVGAKIALVVKRVSMGGSLVDGIRVDRVGRPNSGNVTQPKQEPAPQTQGRHDDFGATSDYQAASQSSGIRPQPMQSSQDDFDDAIPF